VKRLQASLLLLALAAAGLAAARSLFHPAGARPTQMSETCGTASTATPVVATSQEVTP
jgi:hypothetical protein